MKKFSKEVYLKFIGVCKKKSYFLVIILLIIALIVILKKTTNKHSHRNIAEDHQHNEILGTANTNTRVTPVKETVSNLPKSPSPSPSPIKNQNRSIVNQTINNEVITKANFEPTFNVSLESYGRANATLASINFGSIKGNWWGMKLNFIIPDDFSISSSSDTPNNLEIGEGNIQGNSNGKQKTISFKLYSKSDTSSHYAKWLMKFSEEGFPELFFFVDRKGRDYFIAFDGPIPLQLTSPVRGNVRLFSNIFRNPISAGTYEWRAEYIFEDGEVVASDKVDIN